MKKMIILLFVLLVSSIALAQSLEMNIEGKCQKFNISFVNVSGCKDVKVDITTSSGRVGEIFDPREGWKSSFFYAKEFCKNTIKVRANTIEKILNFKGKVKQDDKTFETKYYEIEQDCPETKGKNLNTPQLFTIALSVILVLLVGIYLYKK